MDDILFLSCKKLSNSILGSSKISFHNLKWPVSGTKAELIEHLGWAEQPQAFDIFTDSSNRAWFQDTLGPHIVRFLGLRISCIK